jgi:hypothetical protein
MQEYARLFVQFWYARVCIAAELKVMLYPDWYKAELIVRYMQVAVSVIPKGIARALNSIRYMNLDFALVSAFTLIEFEKVVTHLPSRQD